MLALLSRGGEPGKASQETEGILTRLEDDQGDSRAARSAADSVAAGRVTSGSMIGEGSMIGCAGSLAGWTTGLGGVTDIP